jgi:hypothetical protein
LPACIAHSEGGVGPCALGRLRRFEGWVHD